MTRSIYTIFYIVHKYASIRGIYSERGIYTELLYAIIGVRRTSAET